MQLSPKMDKNLHLLTPSGEITAPITIQFIANTSPVTDDTVTSMSVCLIFDNREYVGIGTQYPYMDAFANIQKQLPNGILLKGCINCVHGNLCPYGDEPYQVYCSKQLVITEKIDLVYHWGNDLTNNNAREFSDVCNDYKVQSPDTYTYTDYFDFLSK